MKIGIYGGSFDPVHFGHLNVARSAVVDLGLDRLIVIPANVSPFKTGMGQQADDSRNEQQADCNKKEPQAGGEKIYEWASRLEMVKSVFAAVEKAEVDDRELRRGGVSYAIDTVREIAAENPGAEIVFIIGEDSVAGLPRWKDYDELVKLCAFKAYPRTKESSTGIRELFASAEVMRNPDERIAAVVTDGLKRKGGFCPCRLPKLPEFFCPCDEFKAQLRDAAYHGPCHCRLYVKN